MLSRGTNILISVVCGFLIARVLDAIFISPEMPSTTKHVEASDSWDARWFRALHQVETGGSLNPPRGDSGRALGPLQIHRIYFVDATEHNAKHGYCWFAPGTTYEQCRDLRTARGVVRAYMHRYAREAWEAEDAVTCARVHNGGPKGATKSATIEYGARFLREFERVE